jgi:hypothetical protein
VVLFKILMKLSFLPTSTLQQRTGSGESFVAEMSQEGQKRLRPL